MENVVEDKLSFVFQPTLQHMTMAKIAIQMWTQDDVIALMPDTKFYEPEFTDEMEVVLKMKENVQKLHLPGLLKNQLSAFIKPIGLQIFQWYFYLRSSFHLKRLNASELRWTPQGTIDKKSSVFVLVRDRSLKVDMRFKLACNYCLIEEIDDFEGDSPGEQDDKDIVFPVFNRRELVTYWSCFLTETMEDLNEEIEMFHDPQLTPGLYAFQFAVRDFNSVATKFTLERLLTPAEKQRIVYYTQEALEEYSQASKYSQCKFYFTPVEFYPDLVCSLLSQMDRAQQIEVFKERPKIMLECLLIWPYQSLFVETAKRMWEFSKSHFQSLLFDDILCKIDRGSTVCVYRDIFQQFWQLNSVENRKYVMNDLFFLLQLYKVLKNGEKELCVMILSEFDASEKEKLVCEDRRAVFFYAEVVKDGEWQALKIFLEVCGPSEETLVKVKKLVVEGKYTKPDENQKKEFLQILDSFFPDERKQTENAL